MPAQIALISDVHGNSPALRAVLDDIEHQGCARLVMLGDLYNGPDPQGSIDLLRSWCTARGVDLLCLRGNAEAYLLTPDLHSLPRQDEAWNVEMIRQVSWWREHLSREALAWMGTFPQLLARDSACFVHDSPFDRLSLRWHKDGVEPKYQEWFYHAPGIRENLPEMEWQALLGWMGAHHRTRLFCAHTHVPFIRQIGELTICNTGSAGLPLDDDPRPSWILFDPDAPEGQGLSIRRVEYQISHIWQLIEQADGYPHLQDTSMREAHKQMLASGRHWHYFMKK
jgi:predicted phosphodiesterase